MKSKLVFLSLPLLLLASCGEEKGPETLYYHFSLTPVFGSGISMNYGSKEGSYNDTLEAITKRLDALVDPYHAPVNVEASLYTINHTHDPVAVDEDLFKMLKKAVELEKQTEGYFSPWLYEITTLWKTTLFGGLIPLSGFKPTKESIEEAKGKVGAMLAKIPGSSLVFDEAKKTVQRVGDAMLDLGGLAKGYFVERIEDFFEEKGVTVYLIDGGQSSLGFGTTDTGDGFNVRLSYTGTEVIRYQAKNIDSSCSAIYEQYQMVDGVVYSHVIDPKNGLPVAPFSMAYLQGDDSAMLDAFSTSCMLAGIEKTKEWEKKYNFASCLFSDVTTGGHYAKLEYENSNLKRSV